MTTTTLTIHHTAFFFPGDKEPGVRKIQVVTPDGEDFAGKAERAFHDTNAPGAALVEVSREGKCYSLSVGDFVEDEATGECVMCAGSGWLPLTKREMHRLLNRQALAAEEGTRYDMSFHGVQSLERIRAAEAAK